MTTPDPNVGTTAAGGAEGQPVQPVSPAPEAPIGGDAIKLLTEFGGKLTGLEKELRGLQGRQDRNEKTVGSFQEQLARFNQVKAQGNLSDEQALDVLQKQDAEQSRWTNLEKRLDELAGRLGGIGSTPTEQQMVAKVMSEFKLDPKDPFVAAQFQGKVFANETEAEAFAGKVLRDKVNSNQPNQAQAASSPGSASTPGNPDEKFLQLQELYKNYTSNRPAIEALESELKAAGHLR